MRKEVSRFIYPMRMPTCSNLPQLALQPDERRPVRL
jgi:hypothetical protein